MNGKTKHWRMGPPMPKPLETVTLEQQLKKLGKLKELKEKYPEKEADQKMKGIQ